MRDYSDLTPEDIARFWTTIYAPRGRNRRTRLRTPCWPWLGGFAGASPSFHYTDKDGKRRSISAGRLALYLTGRTVSEGRITRSCGDFHCCNPYHVIGAKPIEAPPIEEYNHPQRNQFPLSLDGDSFCAALAPLRFGRSVSLVMDDPRFAVMKKYRGKKAKKLIFLTPGQLLEIDREAVLVSVVGSGSCVIWPKRSPKVADLVLAGMPAKLAHVLMEKLHRVFQE